MEGPCSLRERRGTRNRGGGRGGGKGGFVRTRAFYGEPTPHRRRARGGGGARRGISRILGETLLLVTRVADSKLDGIC